MKLSTRVLGISSRFSRSGFLVTMLIVIGGLGLTMRAGDIFAIMAAAAASFSGATTTLFLTPYGTQTITAGESTNIDINLNSRVPINAIGATISFPTDVIEVVGFSKQKSFLDLWTEETAIHEDVGEIHFSGGTIRSGGMIGTGTVLTLAIKAKRAGRATLSFKDSEIFPSDGLGVSVFNETRSLTFDIAERTEIVSPQPVVSIPPISTTLAQPEPRTPDVNTDGAINLVDVSIMVMRLVMPYDFHFDLNNDGAINVTDVSIVLASQR